MALLAGTAQPALAHAEFLRANPEPNAVLAAAPAQVEIYFSEAIEQTFSRISVYDVSGAAVDGGDGRVDPVDPTRLTVSLRSLPQGVYTVSWQALSAVDGHVTLGVFAFAVGQAAADSIPATLPEASLAPPHIYTDTVLRWIVFLSIAVLFGGVLFVSLVWDPALRSVGLASASRWDDLTHFALVALFVGNALALLGQAGKLADVDLVWPWHPAVGQMLVETRFGVVWLVRTGLALALAGVVRAGPSRGTTLLRLSLGAGLLTTISLLSHAAADPAPAVSVLVDAIHFAAASAWVGGLVHFALGLTSLGDLSAKDRTGLTSILLPRFSALALSSVAVLIVTGVVAGLARVGSWSALFGTPYGRTLVVKLAIAAPMIALGANNLLRVTPRMRRGASTGGDSTLVQTFRRYVRAEAYLGAGLFLSVAVLTALPPARTLSPEAAVVERARADDLALTLEVSPGRVGVNTFALRLTSGGQPVESAREVSLRFDPLDGRLPPSELALDKLADGEYSAQGANLSLPAAWRVRAAVRRPDRFDAFADFQIDLTPVDRRAAWGRAAQASLLLVAALYLFAQARLVRGRGMFLGCGVLPALALGLAGFSLAARPAPVDTADRISPIPPTSDSVLRGAELYQVHCAACHGVSGRGDGPVGLTLRLPPADLSQHAVPGVHSDGQLFEWISRGYPGSVMPAFEDQLSEQDRWHLVNFIRTLAPP